MRISLTDAGKRFNRDWIFRHLHYEFESGQSYAIIGPNGSGKSTLLQVLSGSMMASEGNVQWSGQSADPIDHEKVYQYISICAPYLDLIEEMTLREFLEFHQGFKPFLTAITMEKIISILGLEKAVNKQIRNYSSGMKQRVKLAQCIFSDVPIVLLDEPCTNFDTAGIELYHQLINDYCKNRLLIVSSNEELEYRFCKQVINMNDYKK
jgi:ABC-type multidrug transport system ATPase subunit